MRTIITPCYHKPYSASVMFQEWQLGGKIQLFDKYVLKDWDQNTNMNLNSLIQIDVDHFSESGKLPEGTEILVLPTWWSQATRLRGAGKSTKLILGQKNAGKVEIELAMLIEGHNVAESIQIRAAIVLGKLQKQGNDIVLPYRPGSILWENSIQVYIEGSAPMFPVTPVDFSQFTNGHPMACWRLEWNFVNMELPFISTVRLYVNTKHKRFYESIVGSEPDDSQRLIRSALKFGVCVEMLSMAIQNAKDIDETNVYEPGTTGQVLLSLLQTLFPDRKIAEIADLKIQHPAEFFAKLQGRLDLFREYNTLGDKQ